MTYDELGRGAGDAGGSRAAGESRVGAGGGSLAGKSLESVGGASERHDGMKEGKGEL